VGQRPQDDGQQHGVFGPGLNASRQEGGEQQGKSRQQQGGGGIVAFDVRGGRTGAWQVIDATRMLSITANLGDVKTTITHPATTTHGRLTPQERAAAGIGEGLVRVAVGLESSADIRADLARGLALVEKDK